MEPFEITERENAILRMHYLPTHEWASSASAHLHNVRLEQQELNEQCARRIHDVFFDVDREFRHIELGLI